MRENPRANSCIFPRCMNHRNPTMIFFVPLLLASILFKSFSSIKERERERGEKREESPVSFHFFSSIWYWFIFNDTSFLFISFPHQFELMFVVFSYHSFFFSPFFLNLLSLSQLFLPCPFSSLPSLPNLDPPKAPSVRIEGITQNTVTTSWRVLGESFPSSSSASSSTSSSEGITGFILSYKKEEESTFQTIRLPKQQRKYILSNLSCGNKYVVRITGFNEVGNGDPSEDIHFSTDGRRKDEDPLHFFLSFLPPSLWCFPPLHFSTLSFSTLHSLLFCCILSSIH